MCVINLIQCVCIHPQNVREKCVYLSPERDILHCRQRVYRLGENYTGKYIIFIKYIISI